MNRHGNLRPEVPFRIHLPKGTFCSAPGCTRLAEWNGMCAGHNKRLNKKGDLGIGIPIGQGHKGKTFISRGGNGKLTRQQLKIHELTKLPMEVTINTAPAKGLLPCLPNSYKVDLACVKSKVAIEIDGDTHKLKKWKFLDKRKTTVLNALGWKVIRFWNHEVDGNAESVSKTIFDTINQNFSVISL
jgi:hypothetical protein